MNAQDITETLQRFFAQTFEDRQVEEAEEIFGNGFANSLFALQLVEFVEGSFSIEVESDDLEVANFRTIRDIVSLVERKLARAA